MSEKPALSDKRPIDSLIKDLAAPQFAKRQAASLKLTRLGKQAIPLLTDAAQGSDREVVSRSIAILKNHLQSENKNLQSSAKAALEKIAKPEKGFGAQLARKELTPPNKRPQAFPGQPIAGQPFPGFQQFPGQPFPGPFPGRPFPGFPQIPAAAQNSFKTRMINGVEEIEVKQPDWSCKIHADPKQSIKVEITEKKNDKPVTRKFEAKNVAELKTKHPEAYKIYQKYSHNGSPSKGDVDFQLQFMERTIRSLQNRLKGADEDIVPAKKVLKHLDLALEEITNARKPVKPENPMP
ncbi:MAG: hypothetical protein ACKVH8_06635 [Pirellulales bacterium]